MKLNIGLIFCVVGGATLAIPNMTRRGILFGLAVPPGFRQGTCGRRSVAEFRLLVGIALIAVVSALFLAPVALLQPVSATGPLLILLAGAIAFVREHRKIAPFAVEPLRQREADLSRAPEKLPWFTWLAPGPFAILSAAAVFLQLNWDRIPAVFPVHWGLDGQPNRWGHRDVHGIYGPLLFGAELCAWMLAMGLATWFGARRSRFRLVTLASVIGLVYMLALLFTAISVSSFLHIPLWLIAFGPIIFIVPSIVAMARAVAEPGEKVESTPNECWKAGMIYYNPNDAALFVERRAGLGYTFNFGNRWSWILLVSLGFIIGTAPLLM